MDEEHTELSDALAFFSVEAPDGEMTRLPVRTKSATIGQAATNDIVLDDDTVSSRHAQLEYDEGSWVLTDLESRNGTFVDGVKLAGGIPTPLSDAVRIAFGAMEVDFSPSGLVDPETAEIIIEPRPVPRTPLSERQAFRLPVWLLVLIVLLIALLVTLTVLYGGGTTTETVVEPSTALQAISLSIS